MQGLARILAGRPGPGVPLGTRKLELALQYPAGADRSPNAHSRAPGPKQRAQTARLGDSYYFAKSEIVESLLRRGARGELSRRAGTALKPHRLPTKAKKTPAKHPTGAPGGRCLPALGIGLPVTTCIARALADFGKTTHVVLPKSYSGRRARSSYPVKLALASGQPGRLLTKAEKTPTKAPTGPRGEPAMLRIAITSCETPINRKPRTPKNPTSTPGRRHAATSRCRRNPPSRPPASRP